MKFLTLFLFLLPTLLFSQLKENTIVLPSSTYHKDRTISIVLPSGYNEKDTSKKYITAYLFDGQWYAYLELVKSTMDYYASISAGVPMIIVSIHSDNRSLEFTPHWNNPNTYNGWRGSCGQADTLTKFLKEEVIPYVAKNYNVNGYNLGIGHSLGGTYVINELLKDKSLFNGIIAASPNLIYDDNQLIGTADKVLSQPIKSMKYAYASAGDAPGMESNFRKGLQKMDSIAHEKHPENLIWNTKYLDGDNHMSTFPTTFNYAYLDFSSHFLVTEEDLDKMCADTAQPLLTLILKKYEEISNFADVKITPTIDDWNSFGYAASYNNKFDDAITLFNEGIKRFPKDHNIYDSKAETLQKFDHYKDARQSYQKAMGVLEGVKNEIDSESYEEFKKTYQSRRDAITDTLIGYHENLFLAKQAMDEKNYKKASKFFSKAFDYDVIRGTHIDRKLSVGAFAMAGKKDEAFKQLDLLANKFKWRGKSFFEEDELLKSLHTDSRWKTLMEQFEKNKEE